MKRLPLSFSLALLVLLLFALSDQQLRADVGGNNPTGASGFFNGNIYTGRDSYDPFTGNMVHAATDITMAGAVGSYGLSFSRISNSRSGFGFWFGLPGAWRHCYEWVIDDSLRILGSQALPTSYSVEFPDGRYEYFQSSQSDTYYRAIAGTRERLIPMDQNHYCYLVLADGGKVKFLGTLNSQWDQEYHQYEYWWSFQAQAIIDPYGLQTVFGYDGNGRLSTITEPAGRSITINYGTQGAGDVVITSLSASDGRSVQYNYSSISPGGHTYTALTSVVYYGNANWTTLYQYCIPNVGSASGVPLLRTANDPMYSGPMKRIAYEYKTGTNADGSSAVVGQLYRERYWNGVVGQEGSGTVVSTLTVNNSNIRTEARGDSKTRTFTYSNNGFKQTWTDFMTHSASKTYDSNSYVYSVTDYNLNTTNYANNALNGNPWFIVYPLTQEDTPGQTNQSGIAQMYSWYGCADTNNRDDNNPYYLCSTTDEAGNVTQYYRDTNHRVTRINYPDGGYETFTYDSSHNYQLQSHRMVTGGTESWTHNGLRQLKDTYRNPDNATGNPTARYLYDNRDRVNSVTDVLGASAGDGNHTTSFVYDDRGQLLTITFPKDVNNGNTRHYITNFYNADGTLQYKTDQLGVYADDLDHTTSYTYDDYKRVKTVTTPKRENGDTGTYITQYFYDLNGNDGSDRYTLTDSNVTFITLPSGKRIKTDYDDNRHKWHVTVGYNTPDAALTTYTNDPVGNVTHILNPRSKDTHTEYDERNRAWRITDALGNITTTLYDLYGRKHSITRPNNQTVTYDSYDTMNRLTQQTVKQTPSPDAVTKYAYYGYGPAGLLYTMQDPRLVALNSTYKYTYTFDNMGRKTQVQYPPDMYNVQRTEQWSYDPAGTGNLYQFTNRDSKVQTFYYDALNRMTSFSWNDGGITPGVNFGYDAASRMISANNVNANITRQYYNDNLLYAETETITGGVAKTVTYTYDADGNRGGTTYPAPESYAFGYTYTNRNQLKTVNGWATYTYDGYPYTGDLTTRTLNNSPNVTTSSTYQYDDLDRVIDITHSLVGSRDTFDYAYDSVGNRKWTRRENNVGDLFTYDLNDQANGVWLNVSSPSSTPTPAPNITYDANGNRTNFVSDSYASNYLNQYTSRNSISASYDFKGNLLVSPDLGGNQLSCTYDAQNRLVSATKNGITDTFTYDGLNRQVSRTVSNNFSPAYGTTFNVWDGWDLIEEYQSANGGAATAAYVYGAGDLIAEKISGHYYYHDGSGSTSHLADVNGNLLEWYRYDLQGTPFVNGDANTHASAYGVRHLFTGQQWYSELGLYDLRNRFSSPDIGRFLQPDPIRFNGDRTNLYRYCGNNSVNRLDPDGTFDVVFREINIAGVQEAGPVSNDLLLQLGTSAAIGFVLGADPVVGIAAGAWIGMEWYENYELLHGGGPQPDELENNNPEPFNPKEGGYEFLYLSVESDDASSPPDNNSASSPVSAPRPYWSDEGLQPGLWYPGMPGPVPAGMGGLSIIGGMFDFGGTSIGGAFGGGLSFTNAWGAYTNPMGSMGLYYGGGGGFFNIGGAGADGGAGPKDN